MLKETRKVYRKAAREIGEVYKKALDDNAERLAKYADRFKEEEAVMRKKWKAGEISDSEYKNWMKTQTFAGKEWRKERREIEKRMADAQEEALDRIQDFEAQVYAIGANYQNQAAVNAGIRHTFSIYSEEAVKKLLEENPDILPTKALNRLKSYGWTERQINSIIAQGIKDGKSIPNIAKEIATGTSRRDRQMSLRDARTMMTSAQNTGRIDAMNNQIEMGIRVQKMWMATNDSRTRDSHRNLDGQVAEVNEPFHSDYGEIMYPGAPGAHPADVYNCRCTLGYVYPGYS